ncbi:MAG: hypothetical protein ACOX41_04065 [Anaerovoracaceae bacterium]|jgi:hypothetical protein
MMSTAACEQNFTAALVRCGAPTLAGLKTGNLFMYPLPDADPAGGRL